MTEELYRSGDLAKYIFLFMEGIDTTILPTYLEMAIANKHTKIIDYIMSNIRNKPCGINLLTNYIYKNKEMAKYMIQHGYSPIFGIFSAIGNSNLNIVKYIIEDVSDNKLDITWGQCTAIRLACDIDDSEIFKYLYKVNSQFAMHYASLSNKLNLVDYLLVNGEDPNTLQEDFVLEHYSPLHFEENILHLYRLKAQGVDITKLKGITLNDLIFLESKYKDYIDNIQRLFIHKHIAKIVLEYM